MRQLRVRWLVAAIGAAVAAVVLAQVGAASGPASGNKLFDACLQYSGAPDCTSIPASSTNTSLPGGSEPTLTLKLWNDPSSGASLNIGSLQLQAPAGFSIDTTSFAGLTSGTIAAASASSFQIRNLSLSRGQSVSVTFSTSAPIPCAGGQYAWGVRAKQSNDFSGPPGNDFTQNKTTGLTSVVTPGCKLVFTEQPTSAIHDQLITNTEYDPVLSDPGVMTVQVSAEDANGNVITSVGGNTSVTLTPSGGSFTGVTASFSQGVASFASLVGSTASPVGSTYTLMATSNGFTPATSDAFRISLDGENCRATGGNCAPFTTSIDKNTQVTSSGNGGAFPFLVIDPSAIPGSVTAAGGGCANMPSVGGAIVEESDGRTSNTSGTLTFVYALGKSLVQKVPNNGNPFIPICAGTQRVNGNGTPVSCTTDGQGGWVDETLNGSGTFSGILSKAVCDPATGLWWGVLGTQQDAIPAGNPQETSWQGGSQFRYFTIVVPPPWDARFGSP